MTSETKKADLPLRIALLITLALSLLAIIVRIVYGGGFISRVLELTGLKEEESVVSTYLFSGESFAMCGDKLAVASSVGAQLIEESGRVLCAESFAMDDPAVSASVALSVFYDVGGTAMCVISPLAESILCPMEYPIRFADVSKGGHITVVTDYPEYRGRVTVYSSTFSPLFTLDCGVSGYPLAARVSNDEHLVINCVNSLGSTLRFYALNSEKELNCFEAGVQLILDFDFLTDGTLAVLSEEALYLLDSSGKLLSTVALEDMVLADYCLTGRCAYLLLHNDQTGQEGVLRSYSSKGDLVGELKLERDVYSLSALDRQLLVLYPTELTLYHEDFGDDISYQRVANSTRCLMAGESKALLLGKSGAELIRFRT